VSSAAQRKLDHRANIERKAGEFASRVNHTVKAFLGREEDVMHVDASGIRVVVKTVQAEGLTLTVGGKPLFRLGAKYYCELNQAKTYLAVEQSIFTVFHFARTEPILRYDFLRRPKSDIPSAHINMHSESEALVAAMEDAGRNKRTQRRRAAGSAVKAAQLHLPLGGPRFRPALEDVLEMLVVELGIDCAIGWRQSLREGRSLWRDTQLRAAIADNAGAAVEALEEMGFVVSWPTAAEERPGLRQDKLEQF
jgi:hypothetical protein